MSFSCPQCRQRISSADFNVRTDVALCRACGHLGRVSDLLPERVETEAVAARPAGTWLRETFSGVEFGATTRSAIAFVLVPFMVVWTGGSVGFLYGSQIVNREFNLPMSLFGIPFLLGAALFWGIALMATWGRVDVRVHQGRVTVFTGVGRVGRRREFDLAAVDTITAEPTHLRYPGSHPRGITLTGRTRFSFGSGLSEERLHFILQTLRALHASHPR